MTSYTIHYQLSQINYEKINWINAWIFYAGEYCKINLLDTLVALGKESVTLNLRMSELKTAVLQWDFPNSSRAYNSRSLGYNVEDEPLWGLNSRVKEDFLGAK